MQRTFCKRLFSRLGVGALLAAALPAGAHHSTAMFDMNKEVTLTGVVKEFQWTNPHTWTVFTVPAAKGQSEYGIEGMSPNYLSRNGWSKHTLQAGDKVTLVIHPLKDGRNGGFMVRVTLPDGKVLNNLPARPRPGAAPAAAAAQAPK